jgi:aspartyl-tRNA(Asn)/glutamyl-tRNA(Gln) amidotransferase subunit C
MSTFDEKEFLKLTKLARIECTEEEKKKLFSKIQNVLSYVSELKEVNTDGVTPCNSVLETLHNVMRDDTTGETLPREIFLANAPAHTGGLVRVPPILK